MPEGLLCSTAKTTCTRFLSRTVPASTKFRDSHNLLKAWLTSPIKASSRMLRRNLKALKTRCITNIGSLVKTLQTAFKSKTRQTLSSTKMLDSQASSRTLQSCSSSSKLNKTTSCVSSKEVIPRFSSRLSKSER